MSIKEVLRPDAPTRLFLAFSIFGNPVFAGYFLCEIRTSFQCWNVYSLEMGIEKERGSLTVVLRSSIERLRPSPSFRRRAWREFQRALDPLAPPRPLPPARF